MTYYYVYITTNLINNHYYIGAHLTNNLNDGYLGSGKALKVAIKKYGKASFSKKILKFFTTKEEMFDYEHLIVNLDVVKDPASYNIVEGGSGGYRNISDDGKKRISLARSNKVVARNIDGTYVCVSKDEFLNSETLVGTTKGQVLLRDKDNKFISISVLDERVGSTEFVAATKGFVMALDLETGEKCLVTTEVFKNNSRYVGHTAGSTQTAVSNLKRSNTSKGIPKPQSKVTCPHCGLVGGQSNMKRWHFNNCKYYK